MHWVRERVPAMLDQLGPVECQTSKVQVRIKEVSKVEGQVCSTSAVSHPDRPPRSRPRNEKRAQLASSGSFPALNCQYIVVQCYIYSVRFSPHQGSVNIRQSHRVILN